MNFKFDKKAGEISFILETALYSREAVSLAARVFSDRARFFVGGEKGNRLYLTIQGLKDIGRGEIEVLSREFLNEALNQDCRLDLAKVNSKMQQIMMAQTLLSAGGERKGISLRSEKGTT